MDVNIDKTTRGICNYIKIERHTCQISKINTANDSNQTGQRKKNVE